MYTDHVMYRNAGTKLYIFCFFNKSLRIPVDQFGN